MWFAEVESNQFSGGHIVFFFMNYILLILFQVVSQGMKEEYKYLWKKRTLIPPPWEVDQVLQCLCHHWLPVCGDFIPPSLKQSIEKLRDFFKVKTERMFEFFKVSVLQYSYSLK